MTKVYLFRGKHPLYESLVSDPPAGIEYIPRQKVKGTEEYSLYTPSQNTIRGLTDGFFGLIGTPRMIPIFARCDVVHSSRGFLPIGPNPFVVDLEHASSFVGMHHGRLGSARTRKMISKAIRSDKCLGILPHCEAALRTLSLISKEDSIHEKASVVYPAVDRAMISRQHHPSDPPRILFMGEYLWKGGREVIESCNALSAKADFRLQYISLRVHPPPSVIAKARDRFSIDYIEGPIPRHELIEKVYARTDIFAMPTYIDTFGYAFLEAMAFGIACVGTEHFAVPEMIEHEVTGLLVPPALKYFDDAGLGHPELDPASVDNESTVIALTECLKRLVESRSLRDRMGSAGKQSVFEGKFSIARRNAILKGVYESGLRR